jgi:prolyl 4-hydroxylase
MRNFKPLIRLTRPLVEVYDGILTRAECEWMINEMEPQVVPSTVVQSGTGNSVPSTDRTSSGSYFQKGKHPEITAIESRVSFLTGIPLENFEGMQVLKYEVGQRYVAHWDYFYDDQPSFTRLAGRSGNRVATALMYLNDVTAGGSTSFPNVGLSVFPRQGQLLFFRYDNADKEINKLTMHSGDPVEAGVKWVATLWARERSWA